MRQVVTFFLMVFLIIVNLMLAKRTSVLTERVDKLTSELELCKAKLLTK